MKDDRKKEHSRGVLVMRMKVQDACLFQVHVHYIWADVDLPCLYHHVTCDKYVQRYPLHPCCITVYARSVILS